MRAFIVDNNVPIAANGDSDASEECVISAIDLLFEVQKGMIVLDDSQQMYLEYKKYLDFNPMPQMPGKSFYLWVHENQFNPAKCEQVTITPHPIRGFAEFPDDKELQKFDPPDRKFVAVFFKSVNSVAIYNATDSDWVQFGSAFERLGIRITNICPEDLANKKSKLSDH